MEILLAAKKCFFRTLSSPADCWGPYSQSGYRGEPPAPFSHLREKVQTAARWSTGLGSGQGQFLSRRVKPVSLPLRLLEDKHSQRQTGKLESRDRFLEDQIWGVNPVVTSEMATSTTWKKRNEKNRGGSTCISFHCSFSQLIVLDWTVREEIFNSCIVSLSANLLEGIKLREKNFKVNMTQCLNPGRRARVPPI